MSRGDLTEAEWRVLKDLLPIERENRGRGRGWAARSFSSLSMANPIPYLSGSIPDRVMRSLVEAYAPLRTSSATNVGFLGFLSIPVDQCGPPWRATWRRRSPHYYPPDASELIHQNPARPSFFSNSAFGPSACVPLRSHKIALLSGNGCYFRQCGRALAGSIA